MNPVDRLPLDAVQLGESPRFTPVEEEHAAELAALATELPPILVHRSTMRVIDGAHRLRAAELRGERTIAVEYFEGSPEAAFVRAVESKAGDTLGLPLSIAERKAAAERIVRLRPELSDRSIAQSSGLSAKTIGEIRRRSSGAGTIARVGRDGRLRPVNPDEGRQRVLKVLSERPDASLREIAQAAGVSLGTAHGVRARIGRGEEPALVRTARPARQTRAAEVTATVPAPREGAEGRPLQLPQSRPQSLSASQAGGPVPARPAQRQDHPQAHRQAQPEPQAQDLAAAAHQPPPALRPFGARRLAAARPAGARTAEAFAGLAVLRRDPSLRFTDHGRALLVWLHRRLVAVSIAESELQQIPPHLLPVVADLALECAAGWRDLAEQLHRRARQTG
ncbi:ParB/RepB/Spo0J family partition protein [Kitasatospora azatica]|uniref:ParB/RepB/Spo0J family partition protein n=1 Tax=Kitasatospora azatica TaxID=58347 RepID=UPI0005673733|nr:ParB/RepB/Spo0J family partition protein [Kitasatospora azatica]